MRKYFCTFFVNDLLDYTGTEIAADPGVVLPRFDIGGEFGVVPTMGGDLRAASRR